MGTGAGVGVLLLIEAQSRAVDLDKEVPFLSSKSVAQLSCLFPALRSLPVSGSVFPPSRMFLK